MKREDVLSIFPEATPEQIEQIMKEFGKEVNPLKSQVAEITGKLDQSMTESSALQNKLDEALAKVQQGMTAEELLAQREAEMEATRRDFVLKSNALDARSIFVSSGYFDDDEIDALVSRVTSDDVEATKAFAQTLVDTVSKQRDTASQATKDDLLKANPSLAGGGSAGTLTKESFDKMTYAEQQKLLAENPGLLADFSKPKIQF